MYVLLSYLFINLAAQVPDVNINNICLPCITIAPDLFQYFFSLQDSVLILCQKQKQIKLFLCHINCFPGNADLMTIRVNGKIADSKGRIRYNFWLFMAS